MRTLAMTILALGLGACAGHITHEEAGVRAHVALAPTQGQLARGELGLRADDGGVRIVGRLQGLKPAGVHGFHVHETGDCSALDASSAGAHYNPAGAAHGDPASVTHHAGDIPNVQADESGRARVDARVQGVSLGGANDIIGRALIVHADPDDYTTQPSGNSGARIACGVIEAD
ncbi:MAG TPA: superoxide dismutase family protein [Dokdonella sp.]